MIEQACTAAQQSKSFARLCVFCGSCAGNKALFADTARQVGTLLARMGTTLIYGGARVGLMGMVADAALAQGGKVVGVIPKDLVGLERAHTQLTRLYRVSDMAARKDTMTQLAEACLVLPGGIGTLDEFFEIWTASYLGNFTGPIGLLNVDDFYTPLLQTLDRQVEEGFLSQGHRDTLFVDASPARLLERMQSYRFSSENKIFSEPKI
ncbi:MAG: TIGR00730 family Rossman fold protein [Deltaproteobacteria bacterium]|nr:MAG: TIGR00730 family Rossman fold protein [Deltaproteobacteria bacterium]